WSSFSPQLAPAAPQVAQAAENFNSCAVIASRGATTADNQQAAAVRTHVFPHLLRPDSRAGVVQTRRTPQACHPEESRSLGRRRISAVCKVHSLAGRSKKLQR